MASSVYTKTGDAGTTGLYTENVYRNHLYAQKLMVQSMNYKLFQDWLALMLKIHVLLLNYTILSETYGH